MLSASITILAREPQFEISPFLHGQSLLDVQTNALSLESAAQAPQNADESSVSSESEFSDETEVFEQNDAAREENALVGVAAALGEVAPPLVRWPATNAAHYQWRDGIGPFESRPERVFSGARGDELSDNALGTHEFAGFCRDLGARPWICANLGDGTARELAQWVEYCNFAGRTSLGDERAQNGADAPFDVEFWSLGAPDAHFPGTLSPELYADLYLQFERAFPRFAGHNPFLIACGPRSNQGASAAWTRRVLERLDGETPPRLHGWNAHFELEAAPEAFGQTRDFSLDEYYGLLSESLKVGAFIDEQRALLNASTLGRQAQLILGAWGTNEATGAQNTLRDALAAALSLDLFHHKADALKMATFAQNALVSSDLGAQLVKTPTFHVFSLYRAHRGGALVPTQWQSGEAGGLPRLSGSASLDGEFLTLSVVNSGARSPVETQISLPSVNILEVGASELSAAALGAGNTPEAPQNVAPRAIEVGFEVGSSTFTHTFTPASISVFRIKISL